MTRGETFSQVTPTNDDAERAVLSAILINKDVLPTIKNILTPADFFSPRHRAIFKAMVSLDGGAIDLITVKQAMMDHETWESGLEEYLIELAEFVSTSAGARHHAEMIKEASAKRSLLVEVGELARNQATMTADELVDRVKEQAERIQEGLTGRDRATRSAPSMADLREYLDLSIRPGQIFTAEDVCRGLGATSRDIRKKVYADLSRLVQETILRKDPYKHGGFRRVLTIDAYDLGGEITQAQTAEIRLPLDLQKLIKIEKGQLVAVSGRYDAGKSSFLFHTMLLNHQDHKVVHFSSPEWGVDMIRSRMDQLNIERPHKNILCFPMADGYEDQIPQEPCIVLVDYIRTNDSPYEIDRQFNRILKNLNGGVALCAIQKHPGLDKPTGGQFAVHAPHHIVLLDKLKDGKGAYICKLFKTKGTKDLEGYFRVFGFNGEGRRLKPYMDTWKKGEIKWSFPKDDKDNNDSKDSI